MWSWCGEADVSKSARTRTSGAGVPGVPPRSGAPLFGKPRLFVRFQNFFRPAFSFFVIMHRLARGLATAAGCSKLTSATATRLAGNWQRGAVVRSTLPPWSTSRRAIHVRVPLPYKVEDGMGDFLSPAALKVIAEDYQQGLLDRLNEQIKGDAAAFFSFHTNTTLTVRAGEGRYQS